MPALNIGRFDPTEKIIHDAPVLVARKQLRDVNAQQKGRRELEIDAVGSFVPSSSVIILHVDIEQVPDIHQIALTLCWTIAESNHLQKHHNSGRRHANSALVPLGVLEGEIHTDQAHDTPIGPLEAPGSYQLG